MSRTRPFLEGLKDINQILVSNYPHEAQLLSLRAHELLNNQAFEDPFFQKHYADDFQHASHHLSSFSGAPESGPYDLPQLMAARTRCGESFRIEVIHADTYVDEKMMTADVCMTVRMVNTPVGNSGECINVMRWHKNKGVWQMSKSILMRYALGI